MNRHLIINKLLCATLLVAAGGLFTACGEEGQLSPGEYRIAATIESDGCGVLAGIDTDTFRVAILGATGINIEAYFVAADGTPDETKMLGTMIDGIISATVTEPWTDDPMSPSCHTEFTKAIVGTISSPETAEFTYTWDETIVPTDGDTCTAETLLWDADPCSSEATITLIEKI